MEEQILAVDLSTEQTLEVNLPEQDNVAQIDVYWQDEVVLDLDASLMYIVSGQQEIQDYVENTSKPEIENFVKTQAEPIVLDVVNRITEPVVTDYIENNVKPQIQDFADSEMAEYAANATAQAEIATAQAGLSEASALAAEATLASVNNKAVEFDSTVNAAKSDIQSATSASITNINNTVSAEIIPNLEGYVSSATNQASIASSKANEAQASASAAKTSETNALNYSNQAKSYAESIDSSTFVKTSGNQTIDGQKTFNKQVITKEWYVVKTDTTRATVPSSNVYSGLFLRDKNGANIALLDMQQGTSGENYARLMTYSPDGTKFCQISVFARNGYVYTYAPTPPASDNSTQIATTAWVNNKKADIVGWVIPNYASGVTKTNNTQYTADTAGLLWIRLDDYNNGSSLELDGKTFAINLSDSNQVQISNLPLFIGKGSKYKVTLGRTSNNTSITFFPLKGVN